MVASLFRTEKSIGRLIGYRSFVGGYSGNAHFLLENLSGCWSSARPVLAVGEFCHGVKFYHLEDEPMIANAPILNQSTGIRMGRKGGLYTVETCLFLPRPLEVVFPFFADAGNLETLTPPWLRFEILTPLPIAMRAGAIIEYRLHLHGIALRWRSEITAWEPPLRFVDEQRQGPYRKWIHEHTFIQRDNGSEMRDFVRYSVPGGWLVNLLFVQREVRRIFEYRSRKLRDLFS
jgi:ligand-binding SRPBCC domain-containing protein